MTLRQITPDYFVAPQLDPEDFPAVAAAGITDVICNRPDGEVPASHRSDVMRAAAERAGLVFHDLPLTHQTFTPEAIAHHRAFADGASGACLAYCASGTRSTIAWAIGQAGRLPVDQIVAAAAAAGYDLENIRPTLEAATDAHNHAS